MSESNLSLDWKIGELGQVFSRTIQTGDDTVVLKHRTQAQPIRILRADIRAFLEYADQVLALVGFDFVDSSEDELSAYVKAHSASAELVFGYTGQ